MVQEASKKRSQIFMSYSSKDESVADRIFSNFRSTGANVWFDKWALHPGDSLAKQVDSAVSSSDVLIVLLSPHSVQSTWISQELNAGLSTDLRNRAILLVPVIIADCEIPSRLASLPTIDLRHDFEQGVHRLLSQAVDGSRIDFSQMDWNRFETLVGDLLAAIGFKVTPKWVSHFHEYDFLAEYERRDPFGAMVTDLWLVEARLYKERRVSVDMLNEMRNRLVHEPICSQALVVTNGVLTSFAGDFVTQHRGQLRVIDGTELNSLLVQHSELIARYFG